MSLTDAPREAGFTILESLISIALILLSLGFAIQTFVNILQEQKKNQAIAGFFANDQLIRYEINKLMVSLQRRITETSAANQCRSPSIGDTYRQLALERSVTSSMVFGYPFELKSMASQFAQTTILKTEQFIANANKPAALAESTLAKDVTAAYRRCETQQSIKSGVDLSSHHSLFLCGFSENLMVEVKVTFWNFNKGVLMTCGGMNELPGRGVRATYQAYNYEKIAIQSPFPYSVKKNIGSLFINKSVNQENWESL